MARYLQVCLSGHVVTRYSAEERNTLQPYCATCGRAALVDCPHCGNAIPAPPNGGNDRIPPTFCTNCSKPFPWSVSDTLTGEQQAALKEYEVLMEEQASLANVSIRRRQLTWAAIGVIFVGAIATGFYEFGVLAIVVAAIGWIESTTMWDRVDRLGAFIQTMIEPKLPGLQWEQSYTRTAEATSRLGRFSRKTLFGFDLLTAIATSIAASTMIFHDRLKASEDSYYSLSELWQRHRFVNSWDEFTDFLYQRTPIDVCFALGLFLLVCALLYELKSYGWRRWWIAAFSSRRSGASPSVKPARKT